MVAELVQGCSTSLTVAVGEDERKAKTPTEQDTEAVCGHGACAVHWQGEEASGSVATCLGAE